MSKQNLFSLCDATMVKIKIISEKVGDTVAKELNSFNYVDIKSLDLTGLEIGKEYRVALEQKQIAAQQLLRDKTEVEIAEQ